MDSAEQRKKQSSMTAQAALTASVLMFAGVGCGGEKGTLIVEGRLGDTNGLVTTVQTSNGLEIGDGSLVVQRARLSVEEIEFEGGAKDQHETSIGKSIVELALDGGSTSVQAETVDAGTYHTVGLEPLVGGGSGARFADFKETSPASLILEGTFDGAAFEFRSTFAKELEFPLTPELVVPAGGQATAVVSFDIAAWLTGSDGTPLDPSSAANQATIEANIASSLAVVSESEDNDD